ncbi:urease subunit beta [Stenotrophomonas sp. SORGH_AS_0321]|uniref:urease subunit beta n=1 Tax=Stenotrophomonas sp. SORGH_AS_0321 TaxID=3041787 RepID=UPI002867436A|nr:urease subunit beta [Stenotrophomonas sp. SORGH_AS_0321]MDR6093236.1 urease subunit beta [Stenotrophomonas sp. SORGH_AS_0321]
MNNATYSPGEIIHAGTPIRLNQEGTFRRIDVTNKGDNPISVGSHYHFFETNPQLSFDRACAPGYRLNIPAGDYLTFPPSATRSIDLVELDSDRMAAAEQKIVT